MKYTDEKCLVINNMKCCDYEPAAVFDMTVRAPEIAKTAKCGQFVNILCGDKILRRPISICEIIGDILRLVYQVKGEGTAWMSKLESGDNTMIFGPLGNGFEKAMKIKFKEMPKNIVLIGGGIGVPPMLETLKQTGGDVILGFRGKEHIILENDFKKYSQNVKITTDDGSAYRKGFVTDILIENLKEKEYDTVLACGPMPMLKAIADIAAQKNIPCFVSTEERMGCGIGACLVCACKLKSQGFDGYARVCADGPVFNARYIDWD